MHNHAENVDEMIETLRDILPDRAYRKVQTELEHRVSQLVSQISESAFERGRSSRESSDDFLDPNIVRQRAAEAIAVTSKAERLRAAKLAMDHGAPDLAQLILNENT